MFCLITFEFYIFSCPFLRLPIFCIMAVRACWEWVQVLLIIIPGRETWTGPSQVSWVQWGPCLYIFYDWWMEILIDLVIPGIGGWEENKHCILSVLEPQWLAREWGEVTFYWCKWTWLQGTFSLCFLPREDLWEDTRSAGTLISDPPGLREKSMLFFLSKLPGLWYSVIAAWTKRGSKCLHIMHSVPGTVINTLLILTHCQTQHNPMK